MTEDCPEDNTKPYKKQKLYPTTQLNEKQILFLAKERYKRRTMCGAYELPIFS